MRTQIVSEISRCLLMFLLSLLAGNVERISPETPVAVRSPSTESEAMNLTRLYEQYSSRTSNYCMSRSDFKEIYGNKYMFGLVVDSIDSTIRGVCAQIGQDELRRCLCLKSQQMNGTAVVEEKPDDECNSTDTLSQQLREQIQQQIYVFNKYLPIADLFWPDDIDSAAGFFDKKFPEIRQIFRLEYSKAIQTHDQQTWDQEIVKQLFIVFLDTRLQLLDPTAEMVGQSIKGLFNNKDSRCYKKVL